MDREAGFPTSPRCSDCPGCCLASLRPEWAALWESDQRSSQRIRQRGPQARRGRAASAAPLWAGPCVSAETRTVAALALRGEDARGGKHTRARKRYLERSGVVGHGAAHPLVAAVLLDVRDPFLTLTHDLCPLQVEVFVDHLQTQGQSAWTMSVTLRTQAAEQPTSPGCQVTWPGNHVRWSSSTLASAWAGSREVPDVSSVASQVSGMWTECGQ